MIKYIDLNILHSVIVRIIFLSHLFGQDYHEILHDGIYRSYYLSLPESLEEPIPLIINMHGFGGNSLSQNWNTGMDEYALPLGIAVVYPQGLNNSWNVGTFWDVNPYDDINFISSLIDSIGYEYNVDMNRIYATGMSNGGYMAYELACELSDKIAAFGSVTGNFMLNDEQICNNNRETPIIHFHGTADAVVDYYPPSFDGSLTISESMEFWTSLNGLYDVSVDTMIGINNQLDVIKYIYSRNSTNVNFTHYKVINGGHEWFGSQWSYPTAVNASESLIDYFMQYRLDELSCLASDGDLNDDGTVDTSDFFLILSNVVYPNQQSLSDNLCLDVNLDNRVDIIDLILIIDITSL